VVAAVKLQAVSGGLGHRETLSYCLHQDLRVLVFEVEKELEVHMADHIEVDRIEEAEHQMLGESEQRESVWL
jgi:hypothetical protein